MVFEVVLSEIRENLELAPLEMNIIVALVLTMNLTAVRSLLRLVLVDSPVILLELEKLLKASEEVLVEEIVEDSELNLLWQLTQDGLVFIRQDAEVPVVLPLVLEELYQLALKLVL